MFGTRNVGGSLFTISGDMTPQSPETLFKLPTYEESTSPAPSDDNKHALSTLPPYDPPEYTPNYTQFPSNGPHAEHTADVTL